jgi:2-phosphoglycerate kinase
MEKIKSIPFILFISGVPCVGKTTISYKLLEDYPFFKRITELDMIKTVIRSIIKENENFRLNDDFNCLLSSTTDNNYDTFKQQALVLSRYVKEIVVRQKKDVSLLLLKELI